METQAEFDGTHGDMLGWYVAGNGSSVLKSEFQDPRIFFNVAAHQGHLSRVTLSCLLENCLSCSEAGPLPKPWTGTVFHYNTIISDDGGSPCEAAFLSSNPQIQVRVLCSPTNLRTIKASTFGTIANRILTIEKWRVSINVWIFRSSCYRSMNLIWTQNG